MSQSKFDNLIREINDCEDKLLKYRLSIGNLLIKYWMILLMKLWFYLIFSKNSNKKINN